MIRDVAGANSFCAERQNVAPGVEDEPARSRYIPSDAIERVHGRGKHQCEYKTGASGGAGASGHCCLELHSGSLSTVYQGQPMLSAIRSLPILPEGSFGSDFFLGVSPLHEEISEPHRGQNQEKIGRA